MHTQCHWLDLCLYMYNKGNWPILSVTPGAALSENCNINKSMNIHVAIDKVLELRFSPSLACMLACLLACLLAFVFHSYGDVTITFEGCKF